MGAKDASRTQHYDLRLCEIILYVLDICVRKFMSR